MKHIKEQNLADLEIIAEAYGRIHERTSGHMQFADLSLPGYVDSSKGAILANYISKKEKKNLLLSIREL